MEPTASTSSATVARRDTPVGPEVDVQVAVITMTRNESVMLPRWLRHYGAQVGERNLYVVDDQSDDGSTENLPATVIPLPRRATAARTQPFGVFKAALGSKLAVALLEMYDVVIFTDVDEFLVADPRRYQGLVDYLHKNADRPVIAPIGLNLVHRPKREPVLDPDQPLLVQRRHVKVVPGMCKPAIKRIPARWTGGTHGIEAPYAISRDLLLLHAKYADRQYALDTHQHRHQEYLASDAGHTATWRVEPDVIAGQWRRWSRSKAPDDIDFDTVDLDGIVRPRPDGTYRSFGSQIRVMRTGRLYRLPAWLTDEV